MDWTEEGRKNGNGNGRRRRKEVEGRRRKKEEGRKGGRRKEELGADVPREWPMQIGALGIGGLKMCDEADGGTKPKGKKQEGREGRKRRRLAAGGRKEGRKGNGQTTDKQRQLMEMEGRRN
jgi:hypothetical protein